MAKPLRVEKLPVHGTLKTEEITPEPSTVPIMVKKKEQKRKNVYKRGSTYSCTYYPRDPKTGKKKVAMKGGFRTAAEAEKAQRRLQAEADARICEPSRKKFLNYAKDYLVWKENGLRPNSVGNYERVIGRLTGEIDEKQMDKIDTNDIVRVFNYIRSKGFSDRTVRSYMQRIKTVFNFAEREGDIKVSPFRRFTMPGYEKQRLTAPNREAITALLKYSEGHSLRVPIILSLTLGLRVGEVCGLRFDDFDFEKKRVYIQRQIAKSYDKDRNAVYAPTALKTASSKRFIGVPANTLALVRELMEERENLEESPYVVEGIKRPFQLPCTLSARFSGMMREAGIKCRFHDLRHAYGTICHQQNVSLNVIKDAMGHSDISTTANIYVDTSEMMDIPAQAIETVMNEIYQY